MFTIVRTISSGGYRYCVTDPPHPHANARGYYAEHRVIVENALGRLLEPHEHVHHKDEDKTNNDLANLEVLHRVDHAREHGQAKTNLVERTCPICSATFTLKAHVLRQRLERTGDATCSRACGAKLGRQRQTDRHSYRGGCRCDECRAAHADQQRRYRAKI